MEHLKFIHFLIMSAHAMIILVLLIRIIMRRNASGVSLAWLVLICILPLAGALLYLIVGERRLGKARNARAKKMLGPYKTWLTCLKRHHPLDSAALKPETIPISKLAESSLGVPALQGNVLKILHEAEETLQSMITDIDAAGQVCHLEFYIWNEGGTADAVCEALIRAAKRGVRCRVLVDAVGSADFLKCSWAERLRQGGIKLKAALPVGLSRLLFTRMDLRLHRKIVVIDSRVAYTGSFNLVDPRFFKQEAGVGQWVDAMVRMAGPAVKVLDALFLWDWEVETGKTLNLLPPPHDTGAIPHSEGSTVQVIPSGPGYESDTIYSLLLTSIYSARREIVMTTPYFIPDDAMLTALKSAAKSGVDVTIIIPEKIDSLLVRYACGSFIDELMVQGVRIYRYRSGMLHTKSITIDGELALFGTVNLDMRSFWLDFEVTLCVYDNDFVSRLRTLQKQYAQESALTDPEHWENRTGPQRFIENTARLFSPLL